MKKTKTAADKSSAYRRLDFGIIVAPTAPPKDSAKGKSTKFKKDPRGGK